MHGLQNFVKPTITLFTNKKKRIFLCDSGACKTVITKDEEPPGVKYSKDSITVKSATGHTNVESLTEPLTFEEPLSQDQWQEQVLISATCPVNLLGRDVMQGLKIGVMPTGSGMRAVRLAPGRADILVQEGVGEPHYYYTIDLARNGPGAMGEALVKEAKARVPEEAIIHRVQDLHCTMCFKPTTGQDTKYQTKFMKDPSSAMTLTNLYWDNKGNCAVAVQLDKKDYELFRGYPSRPHVSLSKKQEGRWGYLGELVIEGEAEQKWERLNDGSQVFKGRDTGIYTRTLNWRTRGSMEVHLSAGKE